ncbi:uncharacterized protein BDW43DRAFT_299891 [Aspergillus alliaceus]|uniref:uncharacterized protein n=1 Tax=Petromyces alliaceus TaxID=209559 RepID=UPI0012A772E3|nr:uncharacterized protein BDW43DRAFT_299891 [Aspergillus alliaceus]KAB8233928.1 hypothetical protein BDW43DRAFT_299891 [Aspergillus alliaceus]
MHICPKIKTSMRGCGEHFAGQHLSISFAPLAAAITITQSAATSTHAASLYLRNFVSWRPSYVPLALNIPTSDQSRLDGPSSSPSPSTRTAASTVYVTVIPTGSSSCLFHHSSHGIHSSHHHLPTSHAHAAPSRTTTTSSLRSVKSGTVLKINGCCSDYSHPVTLDKVTTPTPAMPNHGNTSRSAAHPSTTVPAAITVAPSRVTGADEVVRVTITTTVPVVAAADDETCLFV